MPNIVIDVAAEFTGKKAFDKAGKSASGLESAIGSLGKKLAIAFSAKAVLDFGKAAVKAFAEDEKSAAVLANTMKNLGLQFQNPAVEAFIAKLSAATGEVDDNLRPAMQKLLQVTGSVSKSQELLTLALDVSAGSGVSLETVVSDLTAAQSGNTKGLKKYALGLTAAQLKTIKFEDVTDKLSKTFAGSASTAAQTFTGQMKILTTAAGEAQETIGKGLVDAFKILSGTNTGIEPISKAMGDFAQEVSDTIVGLALLIKKLKEIPVVGKGLTFYLEHEMDILKNTVPLIKVFADTQKILSDMAKHQTAPFQLGMSVTGATDFGKAAEIAAKKAEEAAKKAAAAKAKADKLAAAAKIKADKNAADNAAKLAKAGAMFDIDKIQIEAALKGKISDEEKLRLELQRAILNEDADLADKLQKKLEASQRATAALQGQINGIKPLADPFAAWLTTLEGIALTLAAIAKMPTSSVGGTAKINIPKTGEGAIEIITPVPPTNKEPIPVVVEPNPEPPATNNPFAGLGGNTGGFGFSLPSYLQNTIPQSQPAPVTVIVNNNGTTIMQDEFVKVVNEAVVTANTNGQNNYRPGAVPAENL